MTTLQILKAARELISVPEAWTTRTMARSESGMKVDPCSDRAVCWCLHGALQHVIGFNYGLPIEVYAALDRVHPVNPTAFNDTHSYTDTLGFLDQAIALEEARANREG